MWGTGAVSEDLEDFSPCVFPMNFYIDCNLLCI